MSQDTKLKPVPQAHDRYYQNVFKIPQVAKEFLQRYLPADLQARVDLQALSLSSGSFIDNSLRASLSDILYLTTIDGELAYIYFLIEHQHKSELMMPVRSCRYMCDIWLERAKTHPGDKLPIILPIVIYNGDQPYQHETELFKLFEGPEDLIAQQFDRIFHLVDLNDIDDGELRSDTWLNISLFFMKHIHQRDMMKLLRQRHCQLVEIELSGGQDFITALFHYIIYKSDVRKGEFMDFVQTTFSKRNRRDYMTLAEQFAEEGRQEGRQEGLEQANRSHIKNMLGLRYEPEIMARITGLPLGRVLEIIETLH